MSFAIFAVSSSLIHLAISGGTTTLHKWEYDEPGNNVSHWAEHYAECGGIRQSPIDIITSTDSHCDTPLTLNWQSQSEHFVVKNAGHSLKAIPFRIDKTDGSEVSGFDMLNHPNDTNIRLTNGFFNTYKSQINSVYCLDSLHFHWGPTNDAGSEHALNGKAYPLEAHIVHYSCDWDMTGDALHDYANGEAAKAYDNDDVLAVIGILFEIGDANPVLEQLLADTIIDGVHAYHGGVSHDNLLELFYTEFDLMDLLPTNKEYIGYQGSLTTPPCYETVRWHVMKHTMTVSPAQIGKLRLLTESPDITDAMHPNYRPLQDIGDRTIYRCQETVDAQAVTKDEVGTEHVVIDEGEIADVEGTDSPVVAQPFYVSDQLGFVWLVLGIVFMVLFGITLIIIAFLASAVWFAKKQNEYENGDVVWEKGGRAPNHPKHRHIASKTDLLVDEV